MSSPFTILTDPRYLQHDTGGGDHPEIPERLQVISRALQDSDCCSDLIFAEPQAADRKWLTTAHTEGWVFRFEESVLVGKTYIDHTDNQICYESYNIACLAAGAGITGIDLIEKENNLNVFCLVRPPGHHAEANMPFGFCFFNNCVVAARYWQQQYRKKRIVVFDFDAHHGNGIQSAFERQTGVLYISIHEHPSFSYPGTGYADEHGFEDGKGMILNCPVMPGADDSEITDLLQQVITPRIKEWQPDAIIVAAGFDGHREDNMAGLLYSTELYQVFGQTIREWGELFTGGNILSILEGGYELSVLGDSVEAYISGLLDK